MKRVIGALAVGAIAFIAAPAHASSSIPITVTPVVNDDTVGVGAMYGNQPVGGAYVHPKSLSACAGVSYQIPFCVSAAPILP